MLLEQDGPALGLHLNVKKNEIWWPNRASLDPFPAEVDRVDNAGVKLLGAPIGTKAFTTDFVKKKLVALSDVCKALREVDNAQVNLLWFEVVCRTTRSTICYALAHQICFTRWWQKFYGCLAFRNNNGTRRPFQ